MSRGYVQRFIPPATYSPLSPQRGQRSLLIPVPAALASNSYATKQLLSMAKGWVMRAQIPLRKEQESSLFVLGSQREGLRPWPGGKSQYPRSQRQRENCEFRRWPFQGKHRGQPKSISKTSQWHKRNLQETPSLSEHPTSGWHNTMAPAANKMSLLLNLLPVP